jgi:hypothetical protein
MVGFWKMSDLDHGGPACECCLDVWTFGHEHFFYRQKNLEGFISFLMGFGYFLTDFLRGRSRMSEIV